MILRHKSLSWLLSLLVCPLGEGTIFSKELRQQKLEVQATETSTWRGLRAAVKQGTLKPAFILASSVPESKPCQAPLPSLLGVWHSYMLMEAPLPWVLLYCVAWAFGPAPLLTSPTSRALAFISQHFTGIHSTKASETTKAMDKWLWQRLCEWRVLGLFPLSYSLHYL